MFLGIVKPRILIFWYERQKKCFRCGSISIKKNGIFRGKQGYKCLDCGKQFVATKDPKPFRQKIWNEYVWHKQTLTQLAEKYKRSVRWVQRQLDKTQIIQSHIAPQKIVLVADTTFFGSKYGVLVCRCPRLKRNLYFHELNTEKPEEYRKARVALEKRGYVIEAVVIDGKRGVLKVFDDVPVQLCQFHQITTVKRYLTSKPKLDAGKELRAISLTMTISNEKTFTELLNLWETKWGEFIKEKSYQGDGVHWHYTHRRIRSAFRSLKTNLPHLFIYQKFPALKIPNTTNSIDGYFGKLKKIIKFSLWINCETTIQNNTGNLNALALHFVY